MTLERTGRDSAKIVLLEGKNREIRKVLEHFGRRAKVLRRVRIGNLVIGDLADGSFRELSELEVESLRSFGRRDR